MSNEPGKETPKPSKRLCIIICGVGQIASMGAAKAELSVGKTTILSLLAGVYISLGGLAMLSVGGATPGLASVSTSKLSCSPCSLTFI